MSITDHRYRWTRLSTGLANSQYLKNIYSTSFGYTATKKKVSAGTATAVLAATATSLSTQTVLTGITQPDVPRALSVTVGGTASSMLDSRIVITGTNVEGKVISEGFQFAANATATVNGSMAFKTVTSVFIPAQTGTAATVAVGTQNKLGIYHRLIPGNTTVKVITATAISATPIFDGTPTVVAHSKLLELNLVTPLTAPDGSTFMYICYQYDNWQIGTLNDGTGVQSLYHTSTSTSTSSTSTSTTTTPATSTSTSSTSTSSTSISTSSTSSSTSSTSTSTTTTP